MNYLDIIAPAITIIAVACYISQIITRLKHQLSTITAQRDRLAEVLQELVESCNSIDSVDFMPASMPEAFEKAQQALTLK
jgi:cell division septum initiation protein DivIVA